MTEAAGVEVTEAMERAGVEYLDRWAIVPDRWPSAAVFVRELYLTMRRASPPRCEAAGPSDKGRVESRGGP
jgi:hypothetical protein